MFQKLRMLDEKVVERMSEIHRPVLDKIMVMFTYAGTGGMVWWVCFVIPMLISRRFRETSIILTAALCFNFLMGEIIIKKSVGRDRPSTRISVGEVRSPWMQVPWEMRLTSFTFCSTVLTVLLLGLKFMAM